MDGIEMVVNFQRLGTKLEQMEVEAKLFSQWKKGPWLFRVYGGDEILPSYVGDYFINLQGSLLNNQYNGK